MKFQKGQGLVEFALVLPFLMLVIFGLMYIGLVFSDYIALNNIAREAARDAALVSDTTYQSTQFQTVHDKYSSSDKRKLPNAMYTWDNMEITSDKDDNGAYRVKVTLTAQASNDSLQYVFNNILGGSLDTLTVDYYMYSEYEHKLEEED